MSAVSIFVSYSHQDSWFLKEKSAMASAFKLLQQKGVDVWWDKQMNAGEYWDDEIRTRLENADIAVCLVSLSFLASEYIRKKEAKRLLERRSRDGLYIFPVFLSECPWKQYRWIERTQGLPEEGKYVLPHYANRKPQICTRIYYGLEALVKKLLKSRREKPRPGQPLRLPAAGLPKPGKLKRLPPTERLEALRLYFLRRKQWDQLTAREKEELRKDSQRRAAKIEPSAEAREKICRTARDLVKRNEGRPLNRRQLEMLDRRFLLRGRRRRPDAVKPRWVLRAAGLHPESADKRGTWRFRG